MFLPSFPRTGPLGDYPFMGDAPNWNFVREFRWDAPKPVAASWDGVAPFLGLLRSELEHRAASIEKRLEIWDQRLAELGGDPCRSDWSAFRPLRLSREEDWSDWLGHLLGRSETGMLGSALFGGERACYRNPTNIMREWSLPDGYRSDIVAELVDGTWLHVEVKIGDRSVKKTFETAVAIRKKIRRTPIVKDFILLLESDLELWHEEGAPEGPRNGHVFEIASLTWHHVAHALRRCLLAREESISWRVWAHAFVGAIEQTLLRVPALPRTNSWSSMALSSLEQLMVLDTLLEITDAE